jgi:lysophospholipase L1-like esterase
VRPEALFWLTLPVAAVQGVWLRRRALRLPGAPGRRSGAVGAGPPFTLLALGDSIIDGVGAPAIEQSLPVQFAAAFAERMSRRVEWQVEGESGLAVADLVERTARLEGVPAADLVLLSIGVNDVTRLSSIRHWSRKLGELLDLIDGRWPGARIVFAGLPPMARFPLPPQPLRFALGTRAATLDRIATEVIADYPNARHIPTRIDVGTHDFCDDGFHPSPNSCTLWAREIAAIESGSESI